MNAASTAILCDYLEAMLGGNFDRGIQNYELVLDDCSKLVELDYNIDNDVDTSVIQAKSQFFIDKKNAVEKFQGLRLKYKYR
ncbi:hypothetical protein I4U23_018827 [Adineta vaga]|nr:hypothetical protein I4U23_018827 [Adineta vaga]